MIQRLGIYLGALVALTAMLAVTLAISPVLMLINWIEERRLGRRYDAVGYPVKNPPDAAGSAPLARPADASRRVP